jgi:hypothetical protein
METALINPTDKPDAKVIRHLVDALDKHTISLGKDASARCVRDGVKALRTAIEGGAGTVVATLSALDASVDRLHMSHMRPFFKQTLRTLRTELHLDVQYTRRTSALEHPRRDNTNGSFSQDPE